MQRCIHSPVKHLGWSFLWKQLTGFVKHALLDVWQGSEYASKIEIHFFFSFEATGLEEISANSLNINPIQITGGAKRPPLSVFPPINSPNLEIRPPKFLTFNIEPFATMM